MRIWKNVPAPQFLGLPAQCADGISANEMRKITINKSLLTSAGQQAEKRGVEVYYGYSAAAYAWAWLARGDSPPPNSSAR
jgi:hypothetical protein